MIIRYDSMPQILCTVVEFFIYLDMLLKIHDRGRILIEVKIVKSKSKKACSILLLDQ